MRDEEMNYQTDYSEGQKKAANRILIEVVNILNDYREDILIIGGWVPALLFDLCHSTTRCNMSLLGFAPNTSGARASSPTFTLSKFTTSIFILNPISLLWLVTQLKSLFLRQLLP